MSHESRDLRSALLLSALRLAEHDGRMCTWPWAVRFRREPRIRNITQLESALSALAEEVARRHDVNGVNARSTAVKVSVERLAKSRLHWQVNISVEPHVGTDQFVEYSNIVLVYLHMLWPIEDLQGFPKEAHKLLDWRGVYLRRFSAGVAGIPPGLRIIRRNPRKRRS